jgi:hypothetical protein
MTAQLIIGISGLVTVVTTLVLAIINARGIREVHILVNQRMTDVLARVQQLTQVIEDSESAIMPDDPAERHL